MNVAHKILPMKSLIRIRKKIVSRDQTIPCVYFLFLDKEIIYIGRSGNLYQRFVEHKIYRNFTHIAWVEIKNNYHRNNAEQNYIKKYRPVRNIQWNPNVYKKGYIKIILPRDIINSLISMSFKDGRDLEEECLIAIRNHTHKEMNMATKTAKKPVKAKAKKPAAKKPAKAAAKKVIKRK